MKITETYYEETRTQIPSNIDASDMPRYVIELTYANGEMYWRYNPPQAAIDAGVVERQVLVGTRIKAWAMADDLNRQLDQWAQKDGDNQRKQGIMHSPTVDGLCAKYFADRAFTKNVKTTQKDYTYFLGCLCATVVKGRPLGAWKYKDVDRAMANMAYDKWASQGPTHAEHIRSAARRVWGLADTKWQLLFINPWKGIDPAHKPKRDVLWTQEQIQTFMDTAFSRYEWRNVGLAMLLAYELGQRLGDMRTLTWANFIVKDGTMDFVQSKGRQGKKPERVIRKLNEYCLLKMHEQMQYFGDCEFIVPHPGKMEPYLANHFSKTGQRIRLAAGLPNHLFMMDMRRTAVNEALEAGSSEEEIMTMTGHKNVASLAPYVVQNRKRQNAQANKVMESRNTLTSKKET